MSTIDKRANTIQSGHVMTEGDELYYEVRGQGEPFLMIAAGEGTFYAAIADMLAKEYKVITYDRRANGRSTMNVPQNFEVSQQSRDAVAVLRAVGESSAFVFGNSAGAVVALDMAKTQSQSVRGVIAHEAPLARMLPEPQARKWQHFIARVYLTAFRFGSSLAALRFALGAQLPVWQIIKAQSTFKEYVKNHQQPSVEQHISEKDAADVQIKLELLPTTSYLPDVELIKRNGVPVFIAAGSWSLKRKAWYAQAAQRLAEQLGCELVTLPGHHGSYLDMPEEWAVALRSVLHKAAAASHS